MSTAGGTEQPLCIPSKDVSLTTEYAAMRPYDLSEPQTLTCIPAIAALLPALRSYDNGLAASASQMPQSLDHGFVSKQSFQGDAATLEPSLGRHAERDRTGMGRIPPKLR